MIDVRQGIRIPFDEPACNRTGMSVATGRLFCCEVNGTSAHACRLHHIGDLGRSVLEWGRSCHGPPAPARG